MTREEETGMADLVTASRCDARCYIGRDGNDRVWCMLDRGHDGMHAAWRANRWRYEWGDGYIRLYV
ncbi:MAG TPA: hypothetical protein VIV12_22955 [Streptosporangiaceae bacterium]